MGAQNLPSNTLFLKILNFSLSMLTRNGLVIQPMVRF